ncbi:MAG: choice-of-anchor B domain-containing protein [Lentimonas sp.]|jgi:choice-of-anchor B domain-containing protein
MKWVLLFIFLAILPQFLSQRNVELLDNWKQDSLITNSSKARYNECWATEINGKEYGIIGSTEGTHFFEISDQNKLIHRAFVKGTFSNSSVIHRDFKNLGNLLYSVCDEGNSALQIIDMQYLPDSVSLVKEIFSPFGRVHNLIIDSAQKTLYTFGVSEIVNGTIVSSSPMKIFDLADPLNPVLLFDGPNDINYVHDGNLYGNYLMANCGYDGLRYYNISDPSNPVLEQEFTVYQSQGYNHQGDFSPSGDTYIFADESSGTKIKMGKFDSNGSYTIERLFDQRADSMSVPHNLMLDDNFVYVAYYNEGLRIFNYRQTPIKQVAFYDTYTENHFFNMNGAWGIYSKLPSGRILVSDRQNGLFLFGFNRQTFTLNYKDKVSLYPNPASESTTVFLDDYFSEPWTVECFDYSGKKIFTLSEANNSYMKISTPYASGIYTLKITYIGNGTIPNISYKKLMLN